MTARHGSCTRPGRPDRPRRSRLLRWGAVAPLTLAAGVIGALASSPPSPALAADAYAPVGTFPESEGSGLVASRTHDGVMWALRDSGSGERAVLYAFKVQDGQVVDLKPGVRFKEIPVAGARNHDWEALTTDWAGNLWIGDVGNNSCERTNLAVYQVAEPNPYTDVRAEVKATYPFVWPDHKPYCSGRNAESMFWTGDRPYLVSKDSEFGVYRFATLEPGQPNALEKVAELTPPAEGFGDKLATDANLSPNGTRLVVTTAAYKMHVYELGDPTLTGRRRIEDLASRPPRWSQWYSASHANLQVEGSTFTQAGNNVVLLSEGRTIQHFAPGFYEA